MTNLAIIPARSGSKGLKNKNIKELNGKPLIAYTIEAAIESNIYDEIFVSTDSSLYASIGKEYGAEAPFLRDAELSTDLISTWDVVRDTVKKYQVMGKYFNTITVLQPTSPLRNAKDILMAYEFYEKKNANAVISVSEVDHSPIWCNTLPPDWSMNKFLQDDLIRTPRQLLPTYYRINGAIYIVGNDFIMSNDNIYSDNSYAIVIPKDRSIDIDDEIDFKIAELMLEKNKEGVQK